MAQQQLPDYVQLEEKLPDYVQLESDTPNTETQTEVPVTGGLWGRLKSAYDTLATPLINPTPEVQQGREIMRAENPLLSKPFDFATEVMMGMASPLNIATAGSFGAGAALKVPGLIKTGKMLSAPVAAQGAYNIATGETLPEKIAGGIELAGGLAGMRAKVPLQRNLANPSASITPLAPDTPVSPMFNPRGQAGMTGTKQAKLKLTTQPDGTLLDANSGNIYNPKDKTVILGQTTSENALALTERGYVPANQVVKDGPHKGKPIFVFKEAIEESPIEGTPKPASFAKEAYNLSRGLTTTFDMSAPLRQGLPLITTKQWWTNWVPMVKSFGSKGAFDNVMQSIQDSPLAKRDYEVVFRNGKWTRKELPSTFDKMGVALTDLGVLSKREEALMSTWAEKIPVLKHGVKASNRAYTAFLNKLRADTATNLYKDATRMGLDPDNNEVLLKEIGDFVNTATGRGPMRTDLPSVHFGGKLGITVGLKERSLEQHADLLSNMLFSPRLVASRVRMLNPATYVTASPFIRKQYLKAALSTAGAWTTFATLGKMAGAEVSLDPNIADFGKIKVGNTRLDPAGGFQQFLVAYSRLISGKAYGKELGVGYKADTRFDVAERFAANKLHPVMKFAYDMATASEYKPVGMGDRLMQMYVPLVAQDIIELSRENPDLIPLSALTAIGMGTQVYEKGERDTMFIAPENDLTFTGGVLGF